MKRLPDGWVPHKCFYQMLLGFAREKGYKAGWAYHKFEEKCKQAPPDEWKNLASIPPDMRVRNWCKSRQVAYWKGMKKRGKQATA